MSLSLDSYTLLICSRKYFKGILYWCLDVCDPCDLKKAKKDLVLKGCLYICNDGHKVKLKH